MRMNKITTTIHEIQKAMNKQTFWSEKFSIGSVEIPRFMAAPMDGITDSPFRQMIREFSTQELLWGEMRHTEKIVHVKTEKDLEFHPIEQPLGFQFSCNNVAFIKQAVERVLKHGFKLINLNSGCPSRLITRSGSGSALMANVPLLKEILQEFMRVIDGRVPMTIKIRAGFKEKNALEVAHLAEYLGVACIMIHPRTKIEAFSAELDFDIVKKIKESVKVPIVFSGEINNFERAKMTYECTGVDGFMIGRALWGAPWKIQEISEELQGKTFTLSITQIIDCALRHLELNAQFYGPKIGVKTFKKHIPQYIKGITSASKWREKLLTSMTKEEMRELFKQIRLENG